MIEVRLARWAMATRFELVLLGEDAVYLRSVGESLLADISRLEQMLSRFDPTSEVSRLNREAHRRPVRVSARLFRLLSEAKAIHECTDGAFDPTVGPLMQLWGFTDGKARNEPSAEALAAAQAETGMQHVELNAARQTVRFHRPGLSLDLGGIGKGFALDEARYLLEDEGVTHAFLHGGTSTMLAIGTPDNAPSWRVALSGPPDRHTTEANIVSESDARPPDVVGWYDLSNQACSVSAIWGKTLTPEGRPSYGHVLDPRSGQPVGNTLMAAVKTNYACLADALSTALLVLGPQALHQPPILERIDHALLLVPDADSFSVVTYEKETAVTAFTSHDIA